MIGPFLFSTTLTQTVKTRRHRWGFRSLTLANETRRWRNEDPVGKGIKIAVGVNMQFCIALANLRGADYLPEMRHQSR
jgi:hypothetical protein